MELLRLYWQRLGCWCGLVGRDWYGRIGPVTAWRVACSIHPLEDLKKWWLGTGWMGPGAPDWYVGYLDSAIALHFGRKPQKEIQDELHQGNPV